MMSQVENFISSLFKFFSIRKESHLSETQKQVDQVLNIMRDNVDKVLERAEKVKELDERANSLSQSSTQFAQQSARLRRHWLWENLKWKIILVVVTVVVISVILFGLLH